MRRPPLYASIASLALLGAVLSLPGILSPLGAPPATVAQEEGCQVTPSMVADMSELEVGDAVEVGLSVEADCPAGSYGPMHIVFLMQASELMAIDPDTGSNPRQEVRAAATGVLDRLNLEANPWIKVGIVEYAEQPNTLCQLTNDREELDDCLRSLRATGETRLDAAIGAISGVLKRGRGQPTETLQEWVLLFGDGTNDYRDPRTPRAADYAADRVAALLQGCAPVKEEADELKDELTELRFGVVCLATGCDRTCMRDIANPPQWVFSTDRVDRELYPLIERTVQQIGSGGPVAEVVITHTLPAELSYEADSASPPPDDLDDGMIRWLWTNPQDDVFEASLSARAAAPGEVAACNNAEVRVTSRTGRVTVAAFECPSVTITGDAATPTPSEPTPTSTPEATPTPTPIVDFVTCDIEGVTYSGAADSGNELPGATVTCQHGSSGQLLDCGPAQTTDEDGRFVFTKRVFLGDVITLAARASGHVGATVQLEAQGCADDERISAELVLQPADGIFLPLTLRGHQLR